MRRLGNYLRVQRRKWHLTQGELAFLLGYLDQSIIARLEREERSVTLDVARACKVIFGDEPREIFPMVFESVDEGVLARLRQLRERLSGMRESGKTRAKLQLVQQAIERMTAVEEREV